MAEEPNVPSYREILRFYWPLALSWLLMAAELPITTAVVTRSSGPEIQAAAMQMLGGLAIWIESPVIDLLATSTTLSRNGRDFALISRFVWWLMGVTAVVHAAIALTPLYDVVTKTILGVPTEVAEAARLPMAIMIPWSPLIGWRRYLQGVLIRYGRTRLVGLGTAVRVTAMACTCLALYNTTALSGIMVAACALVASVLAEACFIHWASRGVVAERLRFDSPAPADVSGEPLTMARLCRFHLPLTATTMTFMLSLPLTSAAIARAPDGVRAMAAWQVATSLAFLHRCVVFALPEPVIALYKGPATAQKLARFCFGVGLAASLLIPLLAVFGLDRILFGDVMGAPDEIVPLASTAYVATLLVPLTVAMQSYLRGMLTAHHFTFARLGAVAVSTVVMVVVLIWGVEARWPGVITAAAALSAAGLAELGLLGWSWGRAKAKMARQTT